MLRAELWHAFDWGIPSTLLKPFSSIRDNRIELCANQPTSGLNDSDRSTSGRSISFESNAKTSRSDGSLPGITAIVCSSRAKVHTPLSASKSSFFLIVTQKYRGTSLIETWSQNNKHKQSHSKRRQSYSAPSMAPAWELVSTP